MLNVFNLGRLVWPLQMGSQQTSIRTIPFDSRIVYFLIIFLVALITAWGLKRFPLFSSAHSVGPQLGHPRISRYNC